MEKQPFQTPSETLALGLMDHAEIVTKALREAQQGLTDQIEELTQLKKWTVQAALDLQKRADAGVLNLKQQTATSVQNLETERAAFSRLRSDLQDSASSAIRFAVRMETGAIGEQAKYAFAEPLQEILSAGMAVRQNVKDASRLLLAGVFSLGLAFGLFSGYGMVVRTQNQMDGRLDLIESYLARQADQAPAAVPVPALARPGKKK